MTENWNNIKYSALKKRGKNKSGSLGAGFTCGGSGYCTDQGK